MAGARLRRRDADRRGTTLVRHERTLRGRVDKGRASGWQAGSAADALCWPLGQPSVGRLTWR